MTVLQFSNFQKRKTYVLVAIIIGLVGFLLVMGTWGYHKGQTFVTNSLDQGLESLRSKWHLDLTYSELHVTSSGVLIEGLNIKGGFQTSIAALGVEMDFNPFSKTFGSPKAVSISKLYAKTRLSELKSLMSTVQELRRQKDSGKASPLNAQDVSSLLPEEITIEQGDMTLTDDNNNPILMLKGLHVARAASQENIKIGIETIVFKEICLANEAQIEMITRSPSPTDSFPLLAEVRKDGQSFVIKGEVSRNFDSVKLLSKWRDLPFLPPGIKENLVLGDESHFAASLKIVGLRDPANAVITANLIARNVGVNHASIAREPVMFEKIKILSRTKIDSSSQSMISTAKFTLLREDDNSEDTEGFDVLLKLAKNLKEDLWGSYHVDIELPSSPCETIKRSLPSAMTSHVGGFELGGNAALKLSLDIDLNYPDSFIYDIKDATFGCHVAKAPEAYSTTRLAAQFGPRGDVQTSDDNVRRPPNGDYVPIRDISPNLTSALLASEDAGFFSHKGISWPSMLSALRRNLKNRSISLGGSTITMQMVKNLLLSRDRTISRKLEEIFLAWYVETILPKDKILEIYANIIEYGPDIYGINQAANQFFGKSPAGLTIVESAYIATLLPNPKARYVYFCQNKVSENFKSLLNANVQKMYEQNMISDSQLDAALKTHLKFNPPGKFSPAVDCLKNYASYGSPDVDSLRVEF